MGSSQEIVSLAEYMQDIAAKPRGSSTGGRQDLNSHNEKLIIKGENGIEVRSLEKIGRYLKEQGVSMEILGVDSIGNPFQTIQAVVQGVDRNNPRSGYERPVTKEGPHMILAPYAIDDKGELHVFRTIQMRTGQAMIDTPRGLADFKSLQDGNQMYDVDNQAGNVKANMDRIVGEETQKDLLRIKNIIYLGAHKVNSTFVVSKSAIFAIEVDYNSFVKTSNIVTPEEL